MALDSKRADQVIQYALLLAGEEDEFFARQLGPIHLIKYVYLADLAYAERNAGETYTGATWHFHNFGPWNVAVQQRVEPAANAIRAEVLKFDSNYGDDDWIRIRLQDTGKLRQLEKAIPPAITLGLPRKVHRFLGDTPSLLDFVYKTEPMLSAAPGEVLELSGIAKREPHKGEHGPSKRLSEDTAAALRMEQLSNKKKKRFRERVRGLHKKQVAKPKLVVPVKVQRYDDVYDQGVAWLDEKAGSPQLETGEFTAAFSDEVWKSSTRKGEDVP